MRRQIPVTSDGKVDNLHTGIEFMVNRYRSFNGMMVLVWCVLLLALIMVACGEKDEPENPPEPTIDATL